jgi:hypothetical protein
MLKLVEAFKKKKFFEALRRREPGARRAPSARREPGPSIPFLTFLF